MNMVCSKCGNCCRYLVFTVNTTYNKARELLNEDIVSFGIDKTYSDDEIRYFTIRQVEMNRKDNLTYLTLKNNHKDKNKFEIVKRGEYRLIFYTECPLLKDNLCSIWDTRPDVCDYTKIKMQFWRPPGCQD